MNIVTITTPEITRAEIEHIEKSGKMLIWNPPMPPKNPLKSPFKTELTKRIAECIRANRADGTTAMSLDCLFQNVRPPSPGLAGAPLGTNARYYYRQMFNEVVAASPAFKRFASL